MDLTFFPARAKWRSSQSPRRGVPWLCLTGADIVRDGVMSPLHAIDPEVTRIDPKKRVFFSRFFRLLATVQLRHLVG